MKIYISSCVNLSNIGFLDRAMFKKMVVYCHCTDVQKNSRYLYSSNRTLFQQLLLGILSHFCR